MAVRVRQVPWSQVSPESQLFPQRPQWSRLVILLTHRSPQGSALGLVHSQVPSVHQKPAEPQEFPHSPQWLTLD